MNDDNLEDTMDYDTEKNSMEDLIIKKDPMEEAYMEDDYEEEGLEFDETIGEQGEEGEEPATLMGPRRRGKDHEWFKVLDFESASLFHESDLFKNELKSNFNLRKMKTTICLERETYECKFSRKRRFIPCPVKYNFFL